MTNHVHLLVSSMRADGMGVLMKALGQRYVQYINRQYRRSGTLWEGRFRSCLVQQDEYLLSCYRYIELNPVWAGMVAHPGDYPWSSYRSNGQGEGNQLVSPHLLYLQLGATSAERCERYRALFTSDMDPKRVDEIRSATNGNYVLGNERFAEQIAQVLGRRVVRGKAGRHRWRRRREQGNCSDRGIYGGLPLIFLEGIYGGLSLIFQSGYVQLKSTYVMG